MIQLDSQDIHRFFHMPTTDGIFRTDDAISWGHNVQTFFYRPTARLRSVAFKGGGSWDNWD